MKIISVIAHCYITSQVQGTLTNFAHFIFEDRSNVKILKLLSLENFLTIYTSLFCIFVTMDTVHYILPQGSDLYGLATSL